MQFVGSNALVVAAYLTPVAFFVWRIVKHKTELKKLDGKYKKAKYENEYHQQVEINATQIKLSKKLIRTTIYLALSLLLFVWKPLRWDQPPSVTPTLETFITPIYETDKEWKIPKPRSLSLLEQQQNSKKQWEEARRNNP